MATYTGTRKTNPRRQLVMAIAAALALGAAAGLGAWRVGLHGQGTSAVTSVPHVQTQVQQQRGNQASTLPASSGSSTAAMTTAHLYLVASGDEAKFLRGALATPTGQVSPNDAVLTVGPQLAGDEVSWLRATVNNARQLQGLPPFQVLDLRSTVAAPAPGVGDAPATSTSALRARVVYLVPAAVEIVC